MNQRLVIQNSDVERGYSNPSQMELLCTLPWQHGNPKEWPVAKMVMMAPSSSLGYPWYYYVWKSNRRRIGCPSGNHGPWHGGFRLLMEMIFEQNLLQSCMLLFRYFWFNRR